MNAEWRLNGVLKQQVQMVFFAGAMALAAFQLPLGHLQIPEEQYLPLHSLLEVISVVVAFLVCATVWSTPKQHSSVSFLFIGTALAAAGALDFLHLMSFQGMPVMVTQSSAQKSISLHLFARLIVAVTLAGVSLKPQCTVVASVKNTAIALSYSLVVALIFWAVMFHEADLPPFIVPGKGVTPVKTACEWVIIGLLVIAGLRFLQSARRTSQDFFPLICGAVFVGSIGEIFLTNYFIGNDALNLIAHIYKCVCYWLIFKAMFVVGIRRPYEMLAAQALSLKLANETMRKQSLALDSTVTQILVSDLQGRVTWQNRGSTRVSRWTAARNASELCIFSSTFIPSDQMAAAVRSIVSDGGVWTGVLEHKSPGEATVFLDATISPLRNESNDIEGFVWVSDDVTERVNAELKHQRVLGTALDGFFVCDERGQLLEVNDALSQMSGYSVGELLSMQVADLEAVEDLQDVVKHIQKVATQGHDRFNTRHRHKQGHEYPVEISVAFDRISKSSFAFVRDRTELENSATAHKDLERQLQQSQKMQALGQLTGGIAHDFNNILAAVLGYSNLALERFVPDKTSKLAKYLQEVVIASERARDLVGKMLTFAKTQPDSVASPVSAASVIREVEAMLRPSIPSSIQLLCLLDDDLPVSVDAGELNQVLVNLIINARDAIETMGRIEVRLHKVDIENEICAISQVRLTGSFLALDVCDNGCGISSQSLPRLFDPFFTTKDVGKGTGLGLSMVQGILRRNKGHISVHSALGEGSRFRLLFAITPAAPVVDPVHPQVAMTPAGGEQMIWIVDDEAAVGGYFRELLDGVGYRTRLFRDPVQALGLVEAGRCDADLIITDLTMPVMNGIDLARRIHPLDPGLPIFLCTGFSDGVDTERLKLHGIRKVFAKPVSRQELLESLARTLQVPGLELGIGSA